MTPYSNSLASVHNSLGGVSEFQCVPSKTTTLVNMTIMDFFSHFWTELPTWPDTLLKTLTNSFICFRWMYCLHLHSDWMVQEENKMTEWNKICHLYRKFVWIRPVTVLKVWDVHPSKTPYYLITTWRKKPKNDHHENLKSEVHQWPGNLQAQLQQTWHSCC